MVLKRCFIKTLSALIAVCAFTACTNPADDTGGGNTEGGNTPSVPQVREYTVRFTAGEGGTITAKAGGQNIESGSKVKKDTLVTFTAAPTGNTYVVGEWTIAPPAVFKNGGKKGAITAEVSVTEDITIGVQFEQILPPAPGQIRIMIMGDERVDPYKSYIDTAKNTTWGAIKTQIEAKLALKTEWQGGDYGVYAWKLGSENGEALTEGHTLSEDTTVYAVTNYINFRMNGTVLEGYAGAEPRGRIIIPDDVTEIGAGAFKGCTDLKGMLVFPRSLKEIKSWDSDNGAFQNCTGLTGLDLSACTELTEIGYEAFSGCTGFTGNLDLSACTKLTKIGSNAFRGCSGFTGELKLPVNITGIGYGAFKGCTGFTGSLDLSAYTKLTKIESYAFSGCSGFTGELKLPVNITEIGYEAFSGCTGFTGSLDLSACTKLTEIDEYAFSGCTGFTGSLDLSACTKLTKIGSRAFSGCSGFTGELKLPVNITEIGEYTFYYCKGFTGSLDLSACTQLTKIGCRVFSVCSGFTGELKLPVNITEIGDGAFYGCTQAEIKLPQSITKIGNEAFGISIFLGGEEVSSLCKKVKVPNVAPHYDRIKTLVMFSSYPEDRIEAY